MNPHTNRPNQEPCPMCGERDDDWNRKRLERETKKKELIAFIVGRRSVEKFSRRENEIFDAYYDLGIRDARTIAKNYGISVSSVEKYYDRAIDKLIAMDFEL